MSSKKRVLALDVGDKRIGIAVSDPLLITAQGIESYTRSQQGEEADIAYIAALLKQYDAGTLLCGLPKNMNGSIGPQAEKVQAFAEALSGEVGLPVTYWDERLTTVLAERMLIEADVSRKKRRKVIDKLAAVTILQSYLDSI